MLLVGIFLFVLSSMQGGRGMLGFGRSRARQLDVVDAVLVIGAVGVFDTLAGTNAGAVAALTYKYVNGDE